MLLRGRAHEVRRHVHHLFADTDVTLFDEHSCVVDRLGQGQFKHFCLQAALKEFLRGQLQHKVELLLLLSQKSVPLELAHDRGALKKPLRVFVWKCEEVTGGLADFCKGELHAPDFTLAAEAILAAELELLVEALLLERTTRLLESFRVVAAVLDFDHV